MTLGAKTSYRMQRMTRGDAHHSRCPTPQMTMKNVATQLTIGKAGRARVISVWRATLALPASAAKLVALPKSLTNIAHRVEAPGIGASGGPSASGLPR